MTALIEELAATLANWSRENSRDGTIETAMSTAFSIDDRRMTAAVESAISATVSRMEEISDDDRTRFAVVDSLKSHLAELIALLIEKDARTATNVMEQLLVRNSKVSATIENAFGRNSSPVVTLLLWDLAGDYDPEIRKMAARIAVINAVFNRESRSVLEKLSRDRDGSVRQVVVEVAERERIRLCPPNANCSPSSQRPPSVNCANGRICPKP